MDVAGSPLDRLVARLPGLAALCLHVGFGCVRVDQAEGLTVRTSARPGLELLTGTVETLDGIVWSRGLPHLVEDLSQDPMTAGDETGSPPEWDRRGMYAGVPVRVDVAWWASRVWPMAPADRSDRRRCGS